MGDDEILIFKNLPLLQLSFQRSADVFLKNERGDAKPVNRHMVCLLGSRLS